MDKEEAPSPAPAPSNVVMAEDFPDIDMKIRESEFKMKGENIKLKNRIEKLERDVKLCCPDYDKQATKIQSRLRANKERKNIRKNIQKSIIDNIDSFKTSDFITIKKADAYPGDNPGFTSQKLSKLKSYVIKENYHGIVWCPNQNWGSVRIQAKSYEELFSNIVVAGKGKPDGYWICDTIISPGCPFRLLKEKIDEGFIIICENKADRGMIEKLEGKKAGKRQKKRRKTIKKKHSKKRMKSKKKKSKRRKNTKQRKKYKR